MMLTIYTLMKNIPFFGPNGDAPSELHVYSSLQKGIAQTPRPRCTQVPASLRPSKKKWDQAPGSDGHRDDSRVER